MSEITRQCPVCKKPQIVKKEDESVDVGTLAMGSNDAGLKFKSHQDEGRECRGSGVILQ